MDSEIGTPFKIAIKKIKELFGPVIDKASELLSSASVPRVKPSSHTTRPRVAATNGNNNDNRNPGVSNATN